MLRQATSTHNVDCTAQYITQILTLLQIKVFSFFTTSTLCSIGAGIVVDNPLVSTVAYSHLGFNTLCTLLYEDDTLAPAEWANVRLVIKALPIIMTIMVAL